MLDRLASAVSEWMQREPFVGITWLRLVLSVLILLLALVVAQLLRWLLHRKIKREERRTGNGERAAGSGDQGVGSGGVGTARPAFSSWLKLVLQAVLPPFVGFIWIWGVSAALEVVLVRPQAGAAPSALLRAVGWAEEAANLGALFWLVFRLIHVAEVLLLRWAGASVSKWDNVLAVLVVRALRLVTPLLAVILVAPTLAIPPAWHQLFGQGASLLIIGAVGFILCQLVGTAEGAVLAQFRIDVKDNLQARRVYTQVHVFRKIAVIVISIVTAASMLMVFDSVRQLGASILASAGVAGIIVGFAAQRSLAMVLAGMQLALTQPIRLDDVVVVEGEFGWIEEITLTYVVVRIWDLRRLVVPINYFIEKSFQNWTRTSADVVGSIFLYVDYTVPLQALRQEFERLLDGSKLWDRKVKALQVTDAKERTLELRALVSAADASTVWDLRCEIRERLVDFLQRNHPQCLPRVRAVLADAETGRGGSVER